MAVEVLNPSLGGPRKRGPRPGRARGNAGKGRRAGSVNRSTANARDAIAAFVDNQSGRLEELLEAIEAEQGPRAAWQCIMDLVEYHVPKLARTEITGGGGGPLCLRLTKDEEGV